MRSTFLATCAVFSVAVVVACVGLAAAQTTPAPVPAGKFRWNSRIPPTPSYNIPTEILSLNATHVLVLASGAWVVSRAQGNATLLAPTIITTPTNAVVIPPLDVVVFCGVGSNFEGAYVSAINISTGAMVWSVNGSNSNGCSQIVYVAKSKVVVVVTNNVASIFNPASGAQRQLPTFSGEFTIAGFSPKGSTLFALSSEGGGGSSSQTFVLSAVDVATGKSVWNTTVDYNYNYGTVTASAADSGVAGGVVVIGGYAVYSAVNGTLLWSATSAGYGSTFTFLSGIAFVVAQQGYYVYAFDGARGNLLWSRTSGGPYVFLAAYRGLAYFTNGNGQGQPFVAAVGAHTGDQRWVATGVTASMAVAANNELYVFTTLYASTSQTGVLALNAKHGATLDWWPTQLGPTTVYHVSHSSMYIGGTYFLSAFALLQ